jgi:hypothetical protein
VFVAVPSTVVQPARAARSAGPCPYEHAFTQPGASVWQSVTVPPSYAATIFRPADVSTYPGKRPGVLLMHGRGGNQCALEWAARLLAAHGYVTLILTNPTSGQHPLAQDVASHILAARRGVAFLTSTSNPFHAETDGNDVGLVGHSLGTNAIVAVQQKTHSVRAIVALDNLKQYEFGDPATALECQPPSSRPVVPRVPALGEAMDLPCASTPSVTDKLAGYRAWRARGVPAMELVMRSFRHVDFTGAFPDTSTFKIRIAKLRRAGYYMLAWLDRWLLGDASAVDRLLSPTPLGVPIANVLSARPEAAYRSAAFLPGRIECDDLVSCV